MTEGKRRSDAGSGVVVRFGDFEARKLGVRRFDLRDPYPALLSLTWPRFFLAVTACYLFLNLVFAAFYRIDPGSIANLPPNFLACYFFSIETFATVGYGAHYPQTLYGHVLVSIEILTGLLNVSMLTGLAFARFSRPMGRFVFADKAVVAPMDGVPTLMVRVANARHSSIADAQCRITAMLDVTTSEGTFFRRFFDLALVRDYTPALFLSWTVMHRIDAESPLHGLTQEEMETRRLRLQVSVTGLDDAIAANVNAQASYGPATILFDHDFEDIVRNAEDGMLTVDIRHIHRVRARRDGEGASAGQG